MIFGTHPHSPTRTSRRRMRITFFLYCTSHKTPRLWAALIPSSPKPVSDPRGPFWLSHNHLKTPPVLYMVHSGRRGFKWQSPLRSIVNYVACTSNFFLKICVCVQLSAADLFPVHFGEQRGSHCARATRLIFPALDHTRQSELTRI